MTQEPLPPIDDLDVAFSLPEHITNDGLRQLYETLIARMRRECAHLGTSTLVTLLIERIAYNYVVMRWKESRPMGELEGFAHATAQKEYNTFWLSMTQELNRLLKQTDRDFREAVLRQVSVAISSVLEGEDPEVRRRVATRLSEALEGAGL